jgi:hypothetical protein
MHSARNLTGIDDPGYSGPKAACKSAATGRSLNVPPSRLSHYQRMNMTGAVFLPSGGILRLSKTSFSE